MAGVAFISILNRVVKKCLPEELIFESRSEDEEARLVNTWGKVFQAQGQVQRSEAGGAGTEQSRDQ